MTQESDYCQTRNQLPEPFQNLPNLSFPVVRVNGEGSVQFASNLGYCGVGQSAVFAVVHLLTPRHVQQNHVRA
jgi:hypothetical protein